VLIDDFFERVLIGQTNNLLDDLTAFEQEKRWDAANTESAGDTRIVVDVETVTRPS